MYIAFSRLVWGIMLGWVTFASIKGIGSLAHSILASPVWIPMSRINYCAYLIHPIVLTVFFSGEDDVCNVS